MKKWAKKTLTARNLDHSKIKTFITRFSILGKSFYISNSRLGRWGESTQSARLPPFRRKKIILQQTLSSSCTNIEYSTQRVFCCCLAAAGSESITKQWNHLYLSPHLSRKPTRYTTHMCVYIRHACQCSDTTFELTPHADIAAKTAHRLCCLDTNGARAHVESH